MASKSRNVSTSSDAKKPIPILFHHAAKHGQRTMPITDYTCCRPGIVSYDIDMDGGSKRLFIPETVVEVFNE